MSAFRALTPAHQAAQSQVSIWTPEHFSVWRIRALDLHDARPAPLGLADSLEAALAWGANAVPPKGCFYVLHSDARRGRAVMKFYRVAQSARSALTRTAWDGAYRVPLKTRTAEHLFDLAAPFPPGDLAA